METPLELLQNKRNELIKARTKSVASFEKGEIDQVTHDRHMENLTPMIASYDFIIRLILPYSES